MKYLHTLLIIGFAFMACTKTETIEVEKTVNSDVERAVATLNALGDSDVKGVVTFEKVADGVKVSAEVNGIGNTVHGFHIHQFGDCSSDDGMSTGGHYNPSDMDHNSPDADERHMGDMGNLTGAGKGHVTNYSYVDTNIKLDKIIGRAVIVHEGEDDFVTQPTGDAGGRIACGVIGIAQ